MTTATKPTPEITRAAERYLEQYGDPLVMNTYLKVIILVLAVVCLTLAALVFRGQKALASMHPLIVRINDVGRAEAIDYRNFQYRPQEAENKYYLTRWAELYFSRNRFTIERDQTNSLYFLNGDVQRAVIDQDRIQGIQGFAGSGKTTTLSVIRSAAEVQGFQVEGFAPTSRAARQLGEAGVEAGTLQGFLARSTAPSPPEQRHFYFVDESSLASTNQMRDFLSRLSPQDRVLLIGDTRQHQGVEAGRPFEQLQEAGMRTAKLDQIVRQKDPELKSVVEMLAIGQVPAALDALQKQGRVREIPDAEERIRAIARRYVESPEKTLIVSPDNASRRELNTAVRHELKANGIIAPVDHSFRVLVQRQDMTGAERSWASRYEINDVIRYARGSKSTGIAAGEYGKVVGINSSANVLTVERATGEVANYDPRRLTGVSVYREAAREFSVGDRIQFTAPDKSLGVANRDLAVIESVSPNGRISARLDNNRQIEFDSKEHQHFDHGYAVTSHSSQGLTAERVLVNIDTEVHPDLVNSRFAYVSVSRASHEARIYTNDVESMGETLSRDRNKTAAVDFSRALSNPPQQSLTSQELTVNSLGPVL